MVVRKVQICNYNDLKRVIFPVESQENHEHAQIVIKKTAQT